jgi:hypothetical protein
METEKVEIIKVLVKKKFKIVNDIEKDEYAILIKEELVDAETNKRNYEIGIGKVMKFPNKVSLNGKTYRTDELDDIKEGSVFLPTKDLTKKNDVRLSWLLVKVPKQFNRAVDEASWAGNFKNLDDLIKVIDEFKVP